MNKKTFEIINRISLEHCNNVFGYLNEDDLKNEIWAICLEKLKEFTSSRGELEHFLRVAVKNRLVNRFKDITKSVRSPCPRCPFFDNSRKYNDHQSCLKFGKIEDNREECQKWHNYSLSTKSRNSLLNASEPQIERQKSENTLNKLIGGELWDLIIHNIDKSYKRDLDQLMSGAKLSKQRIKRLKREVNKILEEKKKDNLDKDRSENANT